MQVFFQDLFGTVGLNVRPTGGAVPYIIVDPLIWIAPREFRAYTKYTRNRAVFRFSLKNKIRKIFFVPEIQL